MPRLEFVARILIVARGKTPIKMRDKIRKVLHSDRILTTRAAGYTFIYIADCRTPKIRLAVCVRS